MTRVRIGLVAAIACMALGGTLAATAVAAPSAGERSFAVPCRG